MARKMPGRLVALSASAVATVYVAGLLSTQPAAQSVAQAAAPAVSAPGSTLATGASSAGVVVGASASTSTTPTTTSTASSAFTDGSYSATGTSALGNVSVALSIASGKISNVQITRVTTKFPMSRIASLPAQVIKNQTANVNVVTGATYSSQAFKQAVQLALSQAQPATSASSVG